MTATIVFSAVTGVVYRVEMPGVPLGYYGPRPIDSLTLEIPLDLNPVMFEVGSRPMTYTVVDGVLTFDGQPVPLRYSDWPDDTLAVLATAVADLLGSSSGDMTDSAIADSLNAPDQRGLVPLWELSIYLIESGLWLVLQGSQSLGARSALAYLTLPHVTTIDMDRPSVVGMFSLLVSDGVLTQPQVDTIRAMAANRTSRRESLGLPHVTPAAVADARVLV